MNIELKNISKYYDDVKALDNISLSIPIGSTVGIIGHNGSGKTTMMEILSGLRKPDSGSMNFNVDQKYKDKLGVILQQSSFYDDAKVDELIELFATFYSYHVDLDYLMKLTGITSYKNKLYRSLSGGMKQKVNIALALVNDPEILILDEPTTGLDPLARLELWNIIKSFSENSTVLVSSHYMDEIEKYCDYLIFLKDGKLIECGSVKDVKDRENISLEDYYLRVNGNEAKQ